MYYSLSEVIFLYNVNPYNPYGYPLYQTMLSQQNAQPTTTPTYAPQQQQSSSAGPDWIQVPTAKQVEQVSVQPGGKAWVMVQNEPIFALRVADQMGLVSTDYYRFEKIDPASTQPVASDYVTRAEFEQFVASMTGAGKKEGASK